MKRFTAVLLALTILFSVTGLALAQSEALALKIGTDADPSAGLDPQVVPAHTSIRIMTQMYNQLVGLDENLNIVPELALSWEQPDEKTYVFHLRQDVKFHSGREMKSDDVQYSFERILEPNTGALGNSATYFNMIDKIAVVDDYTIRFELKDVNAPFLANLANVCASVVDKEVAQGENGLLQNDGGTGPFTLTEWIPDNCVKLAKFNDYYDAANVVPSGIEFYVMPDMASRVAALRTGSIDLMLADSTSIPLVEGNNDIQIISYTTTSTLALLVNQKLPVFQDVRVRQAMSLAIDREEIIDLVYNGSAVACGALPESLGHWTLATSYEHDIEKAKQLLEQAGYPNGFEVTMTAGLLDSIRDCAVVLQQQLAQIGITVKVENVENAAYIDQWSAKSFELMAGLNNVGTDPSRAVAFYYTTAGGANVSGYSNATVDELCAQAASTTDAAKREELYKQAQEIIADEVPTLIFCSPQEFFFARSTVKGFAPNCVNAADFTQTTLK